MMDIQELKKQVEQIAIQQWAGHVGAQEAIATLLEYIDVLEYQQHRYEQTLKRLIAEGVEVGEVIHDKPTRY